MFGLVMIFTLVLTTVAAPVAVVATAKSNARRR